jgi:cephalosporin hydroxylase
MTLQEIGIKHGTDKATSHFYMDNYEKLLGSWREKEFTLLEIGVASGASIKMWREAFPKARIYGMDINPDCAGEGIFIGSQTDKSFLDSVLAQTGPLDVVIDDGSHMGTDIINTFKMLLSLINSGGLYCVEDCHCFYEPHYSGGKQNNGRTEVYNFFSDIPYHIDVAGRGMSGSQEFAINYPSSPVSVPEYSRLIRSMHVFPSLWIFERS